MTLEEAGWRNLIITIVAAGTVLWYGDTERRPMMTQLTTVGFEDGSRRNDPRKVGNP